MKITTSLAAEFPELLLEWDYEKNLSLYPEKIAPRSNKKAWWKCIEKNHEWETAISTRTGGANCPYCTGRLTAFEDSLQAKNPGLSIEWDFEKNENLRPDQFRPFSNKKVWWICKLKHSWKSVIGSRSNGQGCPYCYGKKPCLENSLYALKPELAKEWDYSKNIDSSKGPKYENIKSSKFVWWRCPEKGHEWKERIRIRDRGKKCPTCLKESSAGRDDFATLYPELLKEWDYQKNIKNPEGIKPNSRLKAHWICSKGHEWKLEILARTIYLTQCPFCYGKKASATNCLEVINPGLTLEWDFNKNKPLTPKDVTVGSAKKIWWKCKKNHSWQASVTSRHTQKTRCPECSGKKVNLESCLGAVNPSLAQEWDYEKNTTLTPKDVMPGSDQAVWWLCQHNHSWEASIYSRHYRKTQCLVCSSRLVHTENCLQTRNPELAKEWDFEKNYPLTPTNVVSGSRKKVWWKCKQREHSWKAAIQDRNNPKGGSNCPECSPNTSIMELSIYSELKYFFNDALNRYKIDGIESDIYIPSMKMCIEYDGEHYHKDQKKIESDTRKNIAFKNQGLIVIRIREKGLPKISDQDLVLSHKWKHPSFEVIEPILEHIFQSINDPLLVETFNAYKQQGALQNTTLLNELKAILPGPPIGERLCDKNKQLTLEWHPNLNIPLALTPENVWQFSAYKVWWLCAKGHAWQAAISKRSQGKSKCPTCRQASKQFSQ